jgi:hypothetical protein
MLPLLPTFNQVEVFECDAAIPFLIARLAVVRRSFQVIPQVNLERRTEEVVHDYKIVSFGAIHFLQLMEAIDSHDKRLRVFHKKLVVVLEGCLEQLVLLFADGLYQIFAVLSVVDEAATFAGTDLLGESAEPSEHQATDQVLRANAF